MRVFAIINSGQSVSGDIDLSKAKQVAGVFVPTITSGDLLARGNFDTVSAGFYRMQKPQPYTGDLRWATGVGSVYVTWPLNEQSPPFLRLETSVAQADTRTLVLITKP
jgi:hypothetical protein